MVCLRHGHDRAFGTGRDLPAYLKARPPHPARNCAGGWHCWTNRVWRRRWATLVDGRARKAILARRDLLLALPAAAGSRPAR